MQMNGLFLVWMSSEYKLSLYKLKSQSFCECVGVRERKSMHACTHMLCMCTWARAHTHTHKYFFTNN